MINITKCVHGKPFSEGCPDCLNDQFKSEPVDIDKLLDERGKRYGDYAGHAQITQGLKTTMHATEGWKRLSTSQRETLDMIAHKIGRVLNGDPNYADSWVDIVGYTQLVIKELG